MDVMEVFRTLRKRWLLTLLLLFLTLAGVAYLAARPGPYEAESQVALLPSTQISKLNGDNPYLSFGSSLTLAADLVRREVMDPRIAAALASRGDGASYQVVDDPDTAGPVLDITVIGSAKSAVEQTLRAVTAEVGIRLADMQVGIRPADRITSLTASFDTTAKLLITKKARLPVALLALGLALTIAIPQIVETFIAARRRQRSIAQDDARDTMPRQSLKNPQIYPRHRASSARIAGDVNLDDLFEEERSVPGNRTPGR